MLEAGNRVHFEPGNCYVQNIVSGRVTPIKEKDGTYEIGIWVQRGESKEADASFTRQDKS